MKQALFSLTFLFVSVFAQAKSFYDLDAISIDGQKVEMSTYRGKTILVVNVASQCGYTSQYEGLQKLFEKYSAKNFVILGFPSNDFGGQEPGTEKEIKKFCKLNYGVNFPLFKKNPVVGEKLQPVYKFLTQESAKAFQGDVKWNFEKFLVSSKGEVIARFESSVEPLSSAITSKIEAAR